MTAFNAYQHIITSLDFSQPSACQSEPLLIGQSGALSAYYAPFDYVNREARVVICGITPGMQQARIALSQAQQAIADGADHQAALRQAKETASFAGAMRNNLVNMLDTIGFQHYLNAQSCSVLFGELKAQVHYTSALRYPVFKDGKNYSGSPSMVSHPFLRSMLDTTLAEECRALDENTIFIPLGGKVEEALRYLANQGVIRDQQILAGLPHPSGANAERIAYFCGNKPRHTLSNKTNPDELDARKARLIQWAQAL
ncbi:hypothetical protein PTW35_26845 (plasmid) [Photobacterium sp. DA100]|uniref:uracil-DNA glycosylase family protein n=1 Tax=Photobacterium sp. DA100 TaxID=3027472 RepID=UPI00247A22C0|nr:uracil-DNA glycosylase family protein [Photobacterium sp. DA100]WEM44870.1 hypothetical protein PTW35_26845 [Photobacterium sp. DA100]